MKRNRQSERYFDSIKEEYADSIQSIQPVFYENSARIINRVIEGQQAVLDIGNGGVLHYDYAQIPQLVCGDLSVSETAVNRYRDAANVSFVSADVLALPMADESFDVVIVSALIHHLAGRTLADTRRNTRTALRECMRVLRKGGALVIIESVVLRWFEGVERLLYPLMQLFFRVVKFDSVYQYSSRSLFQLVAGEGYEIGESGTVEVGPSIWIMNHKVPTHLTPCRATYLILQKGH